MSTGADTAVPIDQGVHREGNVLQCSGPTWYSEKLVQKWPHIVIFTDDVTTCQSKNLSKMPRTMILGGKQIHLRACLFGDENHFT